MQTKNKIIFAGLDNSGKTSIIKSIQKKFSFTTTNPTIGLDRSKLTTIPCLGLEFIAWDLAGQRKFRKQYFEREELIFLNTTTLFYIIDLREKNRYYESLQYLHDILLVFYENQSHPRLVILLHKADPDLLKDKVQFAELKKHIIPKLASCLEEVEYFLYFTSIHDIPSLFRALSKGIIEDHPKAIMIQSILQKYLQMTFSSSAVIFSEDLLIMGEYSRNSKYLQTIYTVTPRIVIAMEKLTDYSLSSNRIILDIRFDDVHHKNHLSTSGSALIFTIPLRITENDVFYLTTLTKNQKSMDVCMKYLPKLQNQLQNLFLMIISPISNVLR